MMPEYGYNSVVRRAELKNNQNYRQRHCKHIQCKSIIYSGFKHTSEESGILLSENLVTPPPATELVERLDEKIRVPLIGDRRIDEYQATTELSFQYSHDRYNTPGDSMTSAKRFLKTHREFYKDSRKNQDVIMVGKSTEDKRLALLSIKDKLIEDGFTRISFYNADTKEEEIIHDTGEAGKTYRVIHTTGMSHPSMIACTALSGPLIGATGDQSFGEALSANKSMVYECLYHKMFLIQDYDEAIIRESEEYPDIRAMIHLLRHASSDDEFTQLGALLRNESVREKFSQFNQNMRGKYDLVGQLVIDGLEWKSALKTHLAHLLTQGKQQTALEFLKKHHSHLNIFDEVKGKTLWQYAQENDEAGAFVQYFKENKPALLMEYLFSGQQDKAKAFLQEHQLTPFCEIDGKTIFEHALELKCYDLTSHIIEQTQTYDDKLKLCQNLLHKTDRGESYLSKLRRDRPFPEHPTTGSASFWTTLFQFDHYHPKPGTKRATMFESFRELLKTFHDLSTYDEKALIGLMLLNKKNIASEYHILSPRKGLLFGSRFYSILEDALKELGVDLPNITPDEEQEYYQALANLINTKPDFLANEYILQSLSQQANIDLPKIAPKLTETKAKKILTQGKSLDDPTIFRTEHGFYKINPDALGKGGWGEVYAAHYYSLEGDTVKISKPLAIKRMSLHQATLLDKEYRLFQQAYPDQHFERFQQDGQAYLAMPLFPGVPLDAYLLSHGDLSQHERRIMAKELLTDLSQIHQKGVTHNALKPKNILFDPVAKKMHIMDFGCAEEIGTSMKYEGIDTAKYAIEYMPPEYHQGTNSAQSTDIYPMTLTLAEILGMSKKELVQARMQKALISLDDESLKDTIRTSFLRCGTLDEALFSNELYKHRSNPAFQAFIQNYVAEPYDFSPYQEQLGSDIIDLLNAMQAKDPSERPSLTQCLERFDQLIGAETLVRSTASYRAKLQEARNEANHDEPHIPGH